MTSEEFATQLGDVIAAALKGGLPAAQVAVELETALDLLETEEPGKEAAAEE